jgi:hypothetical protein
MKVHGLSGLVEGRHRQAIEATEGGLELTLTTAGGRQTGYASDVNRAALWAGLQIERFADAIETYNTDSVRPRSIARLNQTVAQVNSLGILGALCISPQAAATAPADTVTDAELLAFKRQKEAELKAELDGELGRLESDLDAAARDVAAALRRAPDDAEIVRAWKNGNLPAFASLAWPWLHLEDVPIRGVDASLLDTTWRDFPGLLTDPKRPMSEAELEWLMLSFPVEMEQFRRNWTLDGSLLPSGEAPAGMGDVPAPYGWILGPDGRWYPVQIPERPPLPPSDIPVATAMPGGLESQYGGWVTLDNRQGPLYAGEPPHKVLNILAGITGLNVELQGPQSVGENQADYLTYDGDGNVYTHGQVSDRVEPWGVPQGIPEPELTPAPPGTYDPYAELQDDPRYQSFNRAQGVLDLVNGGLKGAVLNNQIDANNSFSGNVTFQQDGGGRTRAVIQLAQLQYNDDGEVEPFPYRTYAGVDEDGDIRVPPRG